MLYRYARIVATGELLQGWLGSEGPFTVPLARHAETFAAAHGVAVAELEVLEGDTLPDLSAARPPLPPPPPTPAEVEREAALGLRLPTFGEIDTLIDTLFPAMTGPQRTFLRRLTKLVRRLVERHGV